ncbi:hypothetical protein C8F04DRAFT_1185275 [Mycena alexandri]|uniref:Uncharacterized protein n=1 Tax=Mycena alexandri TaxID=1745969 RepID=A0AAD6SQH9_9AGAR|nr:hypothetical protein C8F04DRAFT_1185275 [Mycena alexandri]
MVTLARPAGREAVGRAQSIHRESHSKFNFVIPHKAPLKFGPAKGLIGHIGQLFPVLFNTFPAVGSPALAKGKILSEIPKGLCPLGEHCDRDDHKPTVKWIEPEVNALLDELAANKDTHMSGNGFKPAVWAKVVPKVVDANPDPAMKKNKTQCMGKLNYTHGKEYGRCFTTPCPYWTKLNTLFDSMINKATGENVVHLPTAKKRRSCKAKDTSTTPAASSSASVTAASTSRTPLQPIASSSNNVSTGDISIDDNITLIDPKLGAAAVGDSGGGAGVFDDELGLVCHVHCVHPGPPNPKTKKHVRADTDDENDERRKPKRQRSELGGKACCNAEAGLQISHALKNFAMFMAQPLVTTEDLSHVNKVVEILKDKTLLPDNPHGKF